MVISDKQKKVLEDFYISIEKLKEGYDTLDGNQKVQIKFSDSSDTKNIKLRNPKKYDYLIVVLTKESAHLYSKEDSKNKYDYYFYKFNQEEIKVFETKKGSNSFTLSKTKHTKQAIETLNLCDINKK
jgi:hypothetical protein